MIKEFDESIEINFKIPDFLEETINELIKAWKEKQFYDGEEETLISDINRAYYSKDITWDETCLLRKEYLWWG